MNSSNNQSHRLLDSLERIGNRLPDPAALFFIGLLLVMLLSHIAQIQQWSTTNPADNAVITAKSLLASDGIWWLLSHMVENFIQFPPLGIVLVGMLGIGVADRSGYLSMVLQWASASVKGMWLTPTMVFLGIMSSLALDAGYVVLPPIAAVLFILAGRSPVVGIAAVFAGVSAGFGANLLITSIDPLLAGFTQSSAQFLQEDYQVAVTSNWFFMIASTLLLTLVGWFVTSRYVEARYATVETTNSQAQLVGMTEISKKEKNAMRNATSSIVLLLVLIIAITVIPLAPLHGIGDHFPRWVEVTVPLLFIVFLVPGIVYGVYAGTITNHRDVAQMMGATIAALGPYIVLAFFAAQFIEAFKYSHLGEMLAIAGGQWLVSMQLSNYFLISVFMFIVMVGNLFIGSMSAKYAFFAPVFVPMFMQIGISPELTQLVYRMGDSVTNVITPLNPYLVIILALLKEYLPKSGLGTLISIMLPYTIAFTIAWLLLLFIWMMLGIPLGPGGFIFM